jgi:hypothetical protein
MKIALVISEDFYWLAGEPGISQTVHSSAADLRINGQINIDSQARLRAAAMAFRDRGNLQQSISFTTSRKFDTTAEADAWSTTYDAVMPRTGYLDFYDEAGDPVARLVNAVVSPPERRIIGVSVLLTYSVVGGTMLIADGEGDWETPQITMAGNYVTMGE